MESRVGDSQKAMGFRLPARIHFDQMVLSDEASEKTLLIQLADRNIISAETLVERFGEIPEIEKIRIRREEKDRKAEVVPQKASLTITLNIAMILKRLLLQKIQCSRKTLV